MASKFPPRRSAAHFLVLPILVVVCGAPPAQAGDYEKRDFSLRFPAAIGRFSPYGDVAAVGGASAGSTWASSLNPAAVAWRPIKRSLPLSLSPQYSLACFRSGTKLHVLSESLTWDAKQWGVFQPSLAQVRTNDEDTRQGLGFHFDMDYAALQWGRKLGKRFAGGANVNFAESETRFDTGPLDLAKSNTRTYGLRLGGLYEPVDRLRLGLVGDYACARSRDKALFPPTTARVTSHDTTQQCAIRPGASFEYVKDSAVYADYQFAWFDNATGALRAHRFLGGVDHKLWKWLFVRAGVSVDARGAATWTTGFGLYVIDTVSIDVAYQDNPFPELAPDFGRARLLTLSIGIEF